ncbi:MAG: hypothetical protein Kow0026_10760 [Oricola sp.]
MKLEDLPDEICEWCGSGFETNRPTQRFCCEECRNSAKEARRRHPPEARTCPQCGGQFVTRRINQQKYCSERCRYLHGHAFAVAVKAEELRRARAGKTCAHCGKTFDAKTRSDQIYCSERCHRSALYDMRRAREGKAPLAEARAALTCQRCGCSLADAKRIDTKYCKPCKQEREIERKREYKRRKRAEGRAKVMAGADFPAK